MSLLSQRSSTFWRACRTGLLVLLCLGAGLWCLIQWTTDVDVAKALQPVAPAWHVTTAAFPTVLHPTPGKEGAFAVMVENVGGASSEGEVAIEDDVPAGLTVQQAIVEPNGSCSVSGEKVDCTLSQKVVSSGFFVVYIRFQVTGSVGAGPLIDKVTVSGGGASPASDEAGVRIGKEHEAGPAGVNRFQFEATNAIGALATQAAGHPQLLTATLLLNDVDAQNLNEPYKPVSPTKDLAFYLPLGLMGDPTVATQCSISLVEVGFDETHCPPTSRVGTILPMVLSNIAANSPDATNEFGIYNVVPEKGYAAEFAFGTEGYTFTLYANVVRHDGQYMVRISYPGLPVISQFTGAISSFYGDIAEHYVLGGAEQTIDRGSFLTDPSNCGEDASARSASVEANTWVDPDPSMPIKATAQVFPAIEGCENLTFGAGLKVTPETTQADSPSGYEFGLEAPQAPNGASGLGTPPVKRVQLTLPAGTTISPSAANGQLGCDELGPHGIDIEGPESEADGPDGLPRPVPGHCPQASQIATVTATTPLLREGLTGHVFLATPHCGGAGQRECAAADAADGELFGLYLELEAPHAGVIVKTAGKAKVDPATGQITAIFEEIPQFTFSDVNIAMTRGPRAPLANPQACGVAHSEGEVEPWSAPETSAAKVGSSFNVDWDGAGGGCPSSEPFAPTFLAETENPTAGAFSPFSLTLKREDREQNVSTLSTTLPEGLAADFANVGRCSEPQASQPSLSACPANSQIGTVTAAVGPGSEPYYVTGKVFLTGPYKGAPFGLAVDVPAVAGPFNLGVELVRAAVRIDPHTAQGTIVSDPLPQMRDGVPLQLRVLHVSVDAPKFTLNPTSCVPTSIAGTVGSTLGASASVSSRFAVDGCNALVFKPALSGSTEASATKADGTGVRIKVAYPSGAPESNIAQVAISFPKQLPVRLSTLQQACRAVIFEADPASCPSASDIGTATVHTPLFANPLSGPAYLVSYGSAKFPDIVFVLQGEGVTVDVDGHSAVSHAGVLKATFPSVPDVPFSSFETVLPRGSFSQFTSTKTTGRGHASQCGEKLTVPVTMLSHSGLELKASPMLEVIGCGPSVSIVKARAAGAKLEVTVSTSVRGRLKIHGVGLKALVRRGLTAGLHKLTVSLTTAGRRAMRVHGRLRVLVDLTAGARHAAADRSVAL